MMIATGSTSNTDIIIGPSVHYFTKDTFSSKNALINGEHKLLSALPWPIRRLEVSSCRRSDGLNKKDCCINHNATYTFIAPWPSHTQPNSIGAECEHGFQSCRSST